MRYNRLSSGLWCLDYHLRFPPDRGFAQPNYSILPGHFPAGALASNISGSVGSTTETKSIAATEDDAYDEGGGNPTINNATIICGVVASFLFYTGGWRFTNFSSSIKGATISSATLTLEVINIQNSPNLKVYGEDADSAAAWGPGRLPSGITKTTASVTITPTATGSLDIDVTSIVQEIVDRGSYDATKGEIALCIFDNKGAGFHTASFRDFSSGGTPASLQVTWS